MYLVCIRSVYLNPIRRRCSKGCQVSGIPNQLYHLRYISQGFHVTESDVSNTLAPRNYEGELSEVMRRTNKELEEYFH